MMLSTRRVSAVFRKELREYRRNGNIIYGMVVLPIVFTVQPLVAALTYSSGAAGVVGGEHGLLYMLAIPALVPASLSAYAVVGEKIQGTLEPLLTTPIETRELLLGKALGAFCPAVVISYAVVALFALVVELFAQPGVAPALLQGSELLAQLVFTPLLAALSIWIGIGVSTRCKDPRTASQLSIVASLPCAAVTSLLAFKVIPANLRTALIFGALLLILDRVGWRTSVLLFNREKLVTGAR